MCHGAGEHMGRYEELGSHLSQNGLLVFGHDHGGFKEILQHIYVLCIVYYSVYNTYIHVLHNVHSMYVYIIVTCTVGHGRSEGDRVHVETMDSYVQDIIHRVELMKSDYPHLPCILMGHSMVHTQLGPV